jgi:ADP-ribose pyrophosphatase YjhB (NUDIX family)
MGNEMQTGKWTSAGAVVIPSFTDSALRDHVFIVRPAGAYGGYAWTLPKGRVDAGETLRATVLREVFEETGFRVTLLENSYLGAFEGTMSVTHYCIAEFARMEAMPDAETAEVACVPFAEAILLVNNARDAAVLRNAALWLSAARAIPR